MMQWLLGMDLDERGRGALTYTRWLQSSLPPGERFTGVHVAEEPLLHQALRHHHLKEIEQNARELMAAALGQAGVACSPEEQRLELGRAAEVALAELASAPDVRGLIIGRQARRGEVRLVHLGRVARRLLRSLPAPVIVVPPDLSAEHVGDGPLLLAVDPALDAPGAVAFARTLAADLGRELELVYVAPGESQLANALVPATMLGGTYFQELKDRQHHQLEAWCRAHELDPSCAHMLHGFTVERLADRAAELRAPLVICGSRRLALQRRLFTTSVASDLAGLCQTPVAVVPDPP